MSEIAIERLPAGSKLQPTERLYRVGTALIRVRITCLSGTGLIDEYAVWEIQCAPAADESGDVLRDPVAGDNQLFSATRHTLVAAGVADAEFDAVSWAEGLVQAAILDGYRRAQLMQKVLHVNPFASSG